MRGTLRRHSGINCQETKAGAHPPQGGLGHGYGGAQPVMEFYPNNEYGDNNTNWWAPSLSCLGLMTMAAGYLDCSVWKLMEQPTHLGYCRGFAHGRKTS